MLLAYNITWVCKSQGISPGENSTPTFEDICFIGRNLYKLLVSLQQDRRTSRASSAQSTPSKSNSQEGEPMPEEPQKQGSTLPIGLGQLSHGTAHTFLGSTEGTEFMRTWKIPTPVKCADQLKSLLLSELAGAEWELLEQKAWEEEGEGDGVVIGRRRERVGERETGMQSFMSVRTTIAEGEGERRGVSGWTRVKNR
jgi:hypothetical protein